MKTDAKSWTPNHGELISPRKSYQTLCESRSGAFAVQNVPDCQTPSKSLLSSQPISAETEIASKHCAKDDDETGPFKLTCRNCQDEFESDNGFDEYCWECNHKAVLRDCAASDLPFYD